MMYLVNEVKNRKKRNFFIYSSYKIKMTDFSVSNKKNNKKNSLPQSETVVATSYHNVIRCDKNYIFYI